MIIRRGLSTCACLRSKFDPNLFIDPIVKLEELKKPLPQEDPHNFLHPKPMKSDQTPTFYRDHLIDKLTRCHSFDGRKEEMRWYVNYALEKVKRTQYEKRKNAKSEAEKREIIVDPVTLANKALRNCRPLMKLLPVVRGGVTYRVPFPVVEVEAEFRAIQMMKVVCRGKSFKGGWYYRDILAQELLEASRNEGLTIQAKQEHHKLCEANRVFSHYRK